MSSRKLDLPAKVWTPPFSLETFQPAEPKLATPGPSIDSGSSEPYLIGGPAQPRPLQQPTKQYVRSVSRNRWRCCQSFHPANAHPISDMPLCYLPCSDACYWSECGHERCRNCLKGDELEDVWTKEHEVRAGRMALYKQDEEVATRVFQDKSAGQNSARKALQDLQCQVM